MKKLLTAVLLSLSMLFSLASCDINPQNMIPEEKDDVIAVEDGYLVVNGVKTEHKVKTEDKVEIVDGYVVVNGVKIEYKVDCGECDCAVDPVIVTVVDGYIALNGIKTEYRVDDDKCDHEYVISVINGYLAVNGVKTEYPVALGCNHIWTTVTTAPTCSSVGYDTMTCSLCDKSVRVNETAKVEHTYAKTYSIDNDYHWYACTACDDAKDKALHTPDSEGVCTVCQMPISSTPGVVYDFSADGTYAEVIGYNGTAKKVKIAEEYNGLPVRTIYDSAFYGNDIITSVVIPDGVTSIGSYAFYDCDHLTLVEIPNGVTSIGSYAFEYCSALTSVVIPDSVTSIGVEAFSCCTSLVSVVIPNSVVDVGSFAFSECGSLDSVEICGDDTRFGECVFASCTSLTSVVVSEGAKGINMGLFVDCPASIYAEYGFGKYLGSRENPYAVLIDLTNDNQSSYTIHEETKTIGEWAFYDCARMTSIIIPDSVTSIGYYAFDGCRNLTDVYYTGSEEGWQAIEIDIIEFGERNPLLAATMHYNYDPKAQN